MPFGETSIQKPCSRKDGALSDGSCSQRPWQSGGAECVSRRCWEVCIPRAGRPGSFLLFVGFYAHFYFEHPRTDSQSSCGYFIINLYVGTPSQGRSPYAPGDLLKKVDQNFYEMDWNGFWVTGILIYLVVFLKFLVCFIKSWIIKTCGLAANPTPGDWILRSKFNLAIGQDFSTLSIFYMPD